jgi:predicted nuclease with TOPRIM domain
MSEYQNYTKGELMDVIDELQSEIMGLEEEIISINQENSNLEKCLEITLEEALEETKEFQDYKETFEGTLVDQMKTEFLLANWDKIKLEDLEQIVK